MGRIIEEWTKWNLFVTQPLKIWSANFKKLHSTIFTWSVIEYFVPNGLYYWLTGCEIVNWSNFWALMNNLEAWCLCVPQNLMFFLYQVFELLTLECSDLFTFLWTFWWIKVNNRVIILAIIVEIIIFISEYMNLYRKSCNPLCSWKV